MFPKHMIQYEILNEKLNPLDDEPN